VSELEPEDVEAEAVGEAYNPTVKTENNTGGFKPGRDDDEEDEG
jgi:hypothetical protein